MARKKKTNAPAFEMLRRRLRAHRARITRVHRNVVSGRWLRAFYKNILPTDTSSAKVQQFLPIRDCQLLVSVVDNICDAPETLSAMAENKHPEVRTAVADHPSAPVEVLMTLAHDPDVDVRYSLAENNNMPSPVLAELTHDENPYVAVKAQNTLCRRMNSDVEIKSSKDNLLDAFKAFPKTRSRWASA